LPARQSTREALLGTDGMLHVKFTFKKSGNIGPYGHHCGYRYKTAKIFFSQLQNGNYAYTLSEESY